MTIKIFHTGDIHLGMKYNSYPEKVKVLLSEARYETLEKMVEKANGLTADLFVIAGDLFNTIQMQKSDIIRTINILKEFHGACVLVLPGNHDYDNGMIDLWDRFIKEANEKIIILNEEKPFDLKDFHLDATIYPAFCQKKHSTENRLTWIKDQGLNSTSKYHIGIAHGALEGLSLDMEGNYYPMRTNELLSIPMNLWLLGHAHIIFPRQDKISDNIIFNAGTPEPDGLDYRYDGAAWFITLVNGKNNAAKITTGQYRFFDQEFEINTDDDLDKVRAWALSEEPQKKVIRLILRGNISEKIYANLNTFYQELDNELLFLKIDDVRLKTKIDHNIIKKEFTKGSFPYEFLTSLLHDEEALQIAYDLLRGR